MNREVIYECAGRLKAGGAPNKITVKSAEGFVLGYYTGYYNPSRRSVSLYPKAAGATYTGYNLYKHSISDTYVRIV